MNDADIVKSLADLHRRVMAHNMLLTIALSELTESSPAARSSLERLLWECKVDLPYSGEDATFVNRALPDMYEVIQDTLAAVSQQLSVPLVPRKETSP